MDTEALRDDGQNFDPLLFVLKKLDQRLEQAFCIAQNVYGEAAASDPYRGLYISRDQVEQEMNRELGVPVLRSPQVEPGILLSDLTSYPAPLRELARAFDLSAFDLDVLVIVLAPELDLRYERIYAFLQDDVTRRRPTIDLALNLLCTTVEEKLQRRSHFAATAPLMRHHLLNFITEPNQTQPSFLAQPLKIDPPILWFLLGREELDSRLASFCQVSESPFPSLKELLLDAQTKQALNQLIQQTSSARQSLILHFQGPQGVGKQQVAAAIASELSTSLLVVHLNRTIALDAGFEFLLQLLWRETELHRRILYLDEIEELERLEQPLPYQQFLKFVSEIQGITILAGHRPWINPLASEIDVISIPFPLPDFEQRRNYWQSHLAAAGIDLDPQELNILADRFRLTPAQIAGTVMATQNQMRWKSVQDADKPSPSELMNELCRAARAQSSQDLNLWARKVEPKYVWDDIVLPTDQLAQLQEICDQVKYQQVVYRTWGFDRKLSLGRGVNVLFAGPPGTGKTMASEVIAHELGLELYKIDLSQVVSKYIGETEKNLDRVFTAAQSANAILFFDEADALFGKRSEVKDAHDRYANIEVGYLLQKMEEYEGVAILATNLRQHLDDAFVRRIQVIIDFPFPDAEYRQRIWQVVFPPPAPLGDDIDFELLAREIKLTGANIKNIGLAAAFYAANEGETIHMKHLIKAAQREYQKLGRAWNEVGKNFSVNQSVSTSHF